MDFAKICLANFGFSCLRNIFVPTESSVLTEAMCYIINFFIKSL